MAYYLEPSISRTQEKSFPPSAVLVLIVAFLRSAKIQDSTVQPTYNHSVTRQSLTLVVRLCDGQLNTV